MFKKGLKPAGAFRLAGRGWHVQGQHVESPFAQTNQQFVLSTKPACLLSDSLLLALQTWCTVRCIVIDLR